MRVVNVVPVGVVAVCLSLSRAAGGPDPSIVPPRLVFSTEVNFTATSGPHTGEQVSQGDELSPVGIIVHTNRDLTAAFCQMPPALDVGLDALHHRRNGLILFSTEIGWFDKCLSRQISDGDLLSNDGDVVRTNAELMANFHPKPVVPDVGLDGVHELFFGEIYFSIEEDIFDEMLGVVLKHGDVLSDAGYVVATNEYLLRNFCIKPVFPDLGLDSLFLPGNGEIWFSTEDGFFNECGGVQVSDGDLLSDAGYVVATNRQLTAGFIGPSGPTPQPLGLDAVWVDLCQPFSGCGVLMAGPQGCPIFHPENGDHYYFIENTGGFGLNERVWVSGCLNPNSQICLPFTAPGIENNEIGRCFEACGELNGAPHGCSNPLLVTDDGSPYAIENADGFTSGDRVWVRGRLNEQSSICFPPFNPAVEDNTIGRCFESCGALAVGPQGCLVLQTDDGNFYFIENTGPFNPGDRVFVRGSLNPGSAICPPFEAPGIEDNTISSCEACCFADGNCALLAREECTAQGGLPQGPGSFCGALSCLQACCYPDGSCADLPPGDCTANGGRPQGLGSSCTNSLCPQPEACCLLDGSCDQLLVEECQTIGGTPQGPGSTCDAALCPLPEACCFGPGICQDFPRPYCLAQGGEPQGPGTTCANTVCVEPEACCLPDGTCQDLRPGVCLEQGGRPQGPGTSCSVADQCPPPAAIVSVCSFKAHGSPPGPLVPCCLRIEGTIPDELSEPRLGRIGTSTSLRGITTIQITFDQPLNNSAFGLNGAAVHIAETTTAIYPLFQPYSGNSAVTTGGSGNVLVLDFTPGLENLRAYRMRLSPQVTSLPDQRFDVRGLVGDVTHDGVVNGADRTKIISVWTGLGFSCETDLNLDGDTNGGDRTIVIAAWTATINTAP